MCTMTVSLSTGLLPSYQRFANRVPATLFSRRSFRPREKYLILLVFVTFGLICFGGYFFLPDYSSLSDDSAVNRVYRVYQQMQKAGPDLLIPAPPLRDSSVVSKDSDGHQKDIPVGHEDDRYHQDIHDIKDKEKLQVS